MSSPVNLCVFAGPYATHHATVLETLKSLPLTHLTVTVVYSDFYNAVFPANFLRNVAISTVFTTHFIEIESSMLPSANLYSQLRQIPVSVLYEPIHLVAIPAFYGEKCERGPSET